MLARKLRFHGHGSLKYVYKNAGTYRSRYYTVRAVTNPRRRHPRFTVVVSKKVHKSAVGRNRIRRRTYEILRLAQPAIPGVVDVAVIVTNSEVLTADYGELTQVLTSLLVQASVIQK